MLRRPITHFLLAQRQWCFRTPSGIFELHAGELIVLPAKQSFEVSIVSDSWDIIWLNLADSAMWKALPRRQAKVVKHANLDGLHFAMELLYLERDKTNRQAAMAIVSRYLRKTIETEIFSERNTRAHALGKKRYTLTD